MAATYGTAVVEELGTFSGDEGTTLQEFMQRITVMADYHGGDLVAYHLPRSLTGKAKTWFSEQVTRSLRANLKAFKTALTAEFSISYTKAMAQLDQERYEFKDVAPRRSPSEYVKKIVRLGM